MAVNLGGKMLTSKHMDGIHEIKPAVTARRDL